MRKKVMLLIVGIIIVLIFVGLYCFHYYYPQKVSFELFREIPKPTESFDNSYWLTYSYIQNEEELMFSLVNYYKILPSEIKKEGYDSIFVKKLSEMLDYKHYDYIISYQKQLKALTYSPYLAKKKDKLGDCEEKKPLIPTFDTVITDKVYIYRIEKNNEYRPPGP